ncbi:MAG: hypothetical protein NC112_08905 [Oxalobacter formigenes]|nr:hypothetical protein [Oxalobacter formigenes]MCM1281471.1 hypothetical protein [Alistipes senegalensis]MCM1513206.1 hypothetical protein [Oxalobacter formigenes]
MTKTLQLYEQVSYELNLFRERRIAQLKKQPCDVPGQKRKKKETGSRQGMSRRFQNMH